MAEWDVAETRPLSEWDVVSTEPLVKGSGRPGGDIPGAEGELDRVAALRAKPEPPRGPKERVIGAVEWALELAAQIGGGIPGSVVGFARGLGGHDPGKGIVPGRDDLERSTAEGGAQGAQAMRIGMRQLGLGPGDPGANTPEGQRYIDATNEWLAQNAPAFTAGPRGMVGTGGPSGMRNAARAVRDVVGAVVDRGLQAVTPEIAPAKSVLAKTAIDSGIPLNVHQVLDNKYAKLAGDLSESLPGSGSKRKARQQAFNGGLARAIDPQLTDVTHLTPDVYDAAMTKAGEEIGSISARTPVPADALSDLTSVARRDTPDIQTVVKTYADDIAKVAADNGGVVPGETFRELRSQASRQARSTPNGDLKRALGDVIKKMDDALSEHAAEGDMEALVDARRRYAIGSTLAPLVAKSVDGNISPTALMGAVTRDQSGKTRMARGRGGELGEYAKIGQAFLKEVGTSNTAERAAVFNALSSPVSMLQTVAGYLPAVGYNMLGPKIAKFMINREAGRRAPVRAGETAPPEPGLAQGFEDVPQGTPPAGGSPLGDLTPDWETTPGAGAPREAGVDAAGLTPALGDETVTTGPRKDLRAGLQIPAVEGRPDLPDTMVVGRPAEVAPDAPTGAAMQTPDAALAREQQLADLERVRAATQSPEVQKVLDEHAAALERQARNEKAAQLRAQNAAELRRAADMAETPDLAAALRKRAEALEGAEHLPVGKAKEVEVITPPVRAPKRIPAGEATEITPEQVTLGDEPIPKGDVTEITPEVVEAPDGKRLEPDAVQPEARSQGVQEGGGAAPGGEKAQGVEGAEGTQGRYEDLKAKLNEHGLSSAEYAEMERLDPSKATPEEATAAAARIGVPEAWMQERRHMIKAGRSDAEILAQHGWEKANDRLMAAHDWNMSGRDAENTIREDVARKMGTRKINKDPSEYTRRVTEAMNKEAERLETERNTPGTLANRRQEKKIAKQREATVAAMSKAEQEEIKLVSDEIDKMRAQGRITEDEFEALADRIGREATDLEDALDIADELIGKKSAGTLRDRLNAKGEAANDGPKDLSIDFPKIDEAFMDLQQRAKNETRAAPSQRNVRAVRAALEEAKASGGLDADGASLALWALDQNPNLAHDLSFNNPKRTERSVELGSYDSAKKIITVFQGTDNPQTAVHEILHHSERMMPPEVQRGIRREWERAYETALRDADPAERVALQNARKAARGDARALDRMKKDFERGVLSIDEHYPLVNPTEFWAVNGARILHERFTGRGSWRAQAVQWLREMVEHVKGIAGVRSDAPVLKALAEVLDPKRTTGEQKSPTQIRGVSDRLDLSTGPPTKDQP